MRVFKFGGASIKSAAAIKNVAAVIQSQGKENLLVVISAMGSTTDQLERIIALAQDGKSFDQELNTIEKYHSEIITGLFTDKHFISQQVADLLNELKASAAAKGDYDFIYDQVIGYGEIISSVIMHHFLLHQGTSNEWIDSRQFIKTDSTFREGQILWTETEIAIQPLKTILKNKIIIAQGFIGSDEKNKTVSLGREGSDFSAAIFGCSLGAESVTIWKDVPGLMNADPKRIPNAVVFEELPFKETAEMTYYGASVIHPKTVKPLANHNIPLVVKSFVDPSLPGTVIHDCHVSNLPPLIVHKENQCLISCKVTDYTFINEEQLGIIFHATSQAGMRINVMQNSAISFSFCVDYIEHRVFKLIGILSKHFEVFYNTNLLLITVKNYDQKTFHEYRNMKGVILEQSSRSALQVLVKDTSH